MGSRLFTKPNPFERLSVYEDSRTMDRLVWVAPYEGFPQGRLAIYFTDGSELILADSPFQMTNLLRLMDVDSLQLAQQRAIAMQTDPDEPPFDVDPGAA